MRCVVNNLTYVDVTMLTAQFLYDKKSTKIAILDKGEFPLYLKGTMTVSNICSLERA